MSSKAVLQNVGVAAAEWEAESPLKWTMHEPARKRGLRPDRIECDLSTLTSGYGDELLLALKDVLISQRHRVQLTTIRSQVGYLRVLLERVYEKGLDGKTKVTRIDSTFVVALHAIAEEIPATYIGYLKRLFVSHRDNESLFDRGLQPSDFLVSRSKRGIRGDRISRILAKALHRATLVHVLNVMEEAFEERRIDLGRYAFSRLALNIFCRPESYRRLTLADLHVDQNPQSGAVNYFLDVWPAKSRVHNPRQISYRLHPDVGLLLTMQRNAVFSKYGHLVPKDEDGRLALFPALRLTGDGSSWSSTYANANAGMLEGSAFEGAYVRPIRALTHAPLTLNGLRHTIGTQLALMGCSAHTIQAVLKHAGEHTCQAYVDIVFDGLIDELSDGLQPAFEKHFPVITTFASKEDQVRIERRIVSEDMETGSVEITAVCGRHVACSYAPIVCYACPRFIPCYDADHSINLLSFH